MCHMRYRQHFYYYNGYFTRLWSILSFVFCILYFVFCLCLVSLSLSCVFVCVLCLCFAFGASLVSSDTQICGDCKLVQRDHLLLSTICYSFLGPALGNNIIHETVWHFVFFGNLRPIVSFWIARPPSL